LKTEEGVINLALVMLRDGRGLKRLMKAKLEFPNDTLFPTLHMFVARKRSNWQRSD
jgi:hypothetical protein